MGRSSHNSSGVCGEWNESWSHSAWIPTLLLYFLPARPRPVCCKWDAIIECYFIAQLWKFVKCLQQCLSKLSINMNNYHCSFYCDYCPIGLDPLLVDPLVRDSSLPPSVPSTTPCTVESPLRGSTGSCHPRVHLQDRSVSSVPPDLTQSIGQ